MKSEALIRRFVCAVTFLLATCWADRALAQVGVGTWVRTDDKGKGVTMTVETCCNGGRRLVYHVPMAGRPPMTLTVESPMDGTDAPAMVGGKPSGETMAVKRVDDHHYTAVVKMNGQPFTTSKGTLSADEKTLTVESVTASPTGKPEKVIETWLRK